MSDSHDEWRDLNGDVPLVVPGNLDRACWYAAVLRVGFFLPDEIRRREDWPPIDWKALWRLSTELKPPDPP